MRLKATVALLVVLVVALLLITGCTGPTEEELDEKFGTQDGQPLTPGNGDTGDEEEQQFVQGTFELSVLGCNGDSIEVKNIGTGSVILNSSTHLESRSRLADFGALPDITVIHPGETKTVRLPRSVTEIEDALLKLDTEIPIETGGTRHISTEFKCE